MKYLKISKGFATNNKSFSTNGKGFETYQRLIKAARPYLLCFLFGIIATAGVSIIDAGFAWLIKPIINKGFIDRDPLFIKWLPLLVVMIFLLRSLSGFASDYCISRVARNIVMDFRRKIFCHLLKLPAKFFDHHNSGYLLSTIIYNVEQVAQASSQAMLTILRDTSFLIGLVVVMVIVSWQLFLLLLLIVPLIIWVVKLSGARLRRLSAKVQQSVGDVTHVADEAINGYKIIRLYGGQDYERDKFYAATKNNRYQELKVIITNSLGSAVVQLLIAVLIAVALLIATLPQLHITAGDFATIITSLLMIMRPMRRLTLVNSDIQKGVAGADSIFTVLDEAVEEDHGQRQVVSVKGKIEFDAVSFAYQAPASSENQTQPIDQGQQHKQTSELTEPLSFDDELDIEFASAPPTDSVLKNINFTIHPGQTVAIVGYSGGGKSTLIHLLSRFYEIQHGEIRIDDISIREYPLEALRRQFAFVTQHPMLFNDTIANNIAYGQPQATRQQILAAADAAYALEFIEQLPNGIDATIGENGVLLSGGQRQRIAIARALLKNAPILILDEATSALDTHSERQIQAALAGLMQKCTTLVIAHRLSTIEHADSIIVLNKGEVIEQGDHQTLLAKGGAYAELYYLQFKKSEPEMV